MALQFCLERLYDFLIQKRQENRQATIIAESRGKKEDRMLREEFEKILENQYDYTRTYRRDYTNTPMAIRFAGKETNSTGMQIAELTAYTMGRHVLAPDKQRPDYDILKEKIFRAGSKQIGLKVFP